ncbi:unnamed protein product [Closterium sp. Naga37s-1]|nr:unnamed protein product [Closterium sp. Naga37s-1]
MGGRWWQAVVRRLSLVQRSKAPLRYSRDPWQGGRAGGAKGVAGAEGFGGTGLMGAPEGVASDRGGGWGSLLGVCAAGAAGCAMVDLGVEKGKEAAGVMADWLLLRVECADVAGLSASMESDDSGSFVKNPKFGNAGGVGGAGGGNERNGRSSSSSASASSSEIAATSTSNSKPSSGTNCRKRVVVLGSGWGAVSFFKAIDAHGYDVTLISPRNFFLFTPLLPSVTTGVVEGRSIAEPIRRILLRHGSSARFLEAECIAIDPASKTLSCRAPAALPAATLPAPLPMPAMARVGGQEEGEGETTRGGAERKGGGASGGNGGSGGGGGAAAAAAAAAASSGGDAVDGSVAAAGDNSGGEARGEGGGESGGAREVHFTVPYDMLVVAVGAVPNTFNVPGVQQHCHFLKSLDDAEAIRNTLIDRFEAASLPGIEAEEQHRLLHVVVVGGGPTGVEVAAAVHDMVEGDLYRLYPALKGKASVSLLQSGDHILNMFDLRISEFAARKFQRDGITVHTHARVTAVTPRALHVRETSSRGSSSSDGSGSGGHSSSSSAKSSSVSSSSEKSSSGNSSGSTQGSREREVPYGVVVWATGITAHPLVVQLREQLGQHHKRALEVDEWMAVRGAEAGSMWALGDCAAIHHRPFTDDTARMFRAFDTNGDGCLSPSETKAALRALQQRYPHAAALLRSRDRMAQLIQDALHGDSKAGAPAGSAVRGNEGGEQQACEGRGLSLEQFEVVLRQVEGQVKTLPATAQVAAQQGQYVARCFNRLLDPALPPEGPPKLRGEGRHLLQPFRYVHLGQFAPLGSETTAAELPGDWVSIGRSTQWLWYSVYASKQVSARTRALVVFDWIKSALFGRDSSRM